ncbi:ubiquitin conjugating enzyme E2 [Reticulomyxa filosa]|uniref:Ubiquitin conjugating enzyme E2 n=1 Tax=Reticulomyxa filosa TaxID=46433 RepID=X6NP93_RETFI|nr:ubiquitin conjugating enzyme E2 [Reticulomyxa filosa]|eukprot:ETO27192.1 ubiquitin conjugating enzyme E2 [Reticulomyxa filosa]
MARRPTIPDYQFSFAPVEEGNVTLLKAILLGPINTPYENGIFECMITLPTTYPFSCPKLDWKTPIHHINFESSSQSYHICFDWGCSCNMDQWSPAKTIDKLLCTIYSLFYFPCVSNCCGKIKYSNNTRLKYNYLAAQETFEKANSKDRGAQIVQKYETYCKQFETFDKYLIYCKELIENSFQIYEPEQLVDNGILVLIIEYVDIFDVV